MIQLLLLNLLNYTSLSCLFIFFRASKMDLRCALEECTLALNLFLNNKFSEALELLRPWYDHSFIPNGGGPVFCAYKDMSQRSWKLPFSNSKAAYEFQGCKI